MLFLLPIVFIIIVIYALRRLVMKIRGSESARNMGENMCSGNYGYLQCHGELEKPIVASCRPGYVGSSRGVYPGYSCTYGSQILGCEQCNMRGDLGQSPEPKESYPQLPPVAPEVLPVGYFPPTALTYERVDPINDHVCGRSQDHRCSPAIINMGDEWRTQRHEGLPSPCRENYLNSGTDSNGRHLENSNSFVTLYKTDWCGACTMMKPVFDRVVANCANTGIKFDVVDCDKTPTQFVKSYPTIILIDKLGKRYEYGGFPDYEQLLRFVMSPRA